MSEDRHRLTKGWYQLRVFYSLEKNCTFWLHEVGDYIFHISILNQDKKEIQVPGGPPPCNLDMYAKDDKLIVYDFYRNFTFLGKPSQPPSLNPEISSSVLPPPSNSVEVDGDVQISTHDGPSQVVITEQNLGQEVRVECVFNCQLSVEHFSINRIVIINLNFFPFL